MNFRYAIIYVPDVKATVAFYEAAFGLKARFVVETGEFAELETGATAVSFAREDFAPMQGQFVLNRADQPAAGAELGFTTEDVAAAVDQAVRAGAVLALPPTVKPWGQTVAYVRDLNGFLVELCTVVTG